MGIIKEITKEVIEEPTYFAKRNGLQAAGKQVAHEVAHPIGETLTRTLVTPDTVNSVAATAPGALGGTMVGLTTVGLAAAVSAGLTQLDYYHKRDNLKEQYKEELAAKLKKPLKEVTSSDLDLIAKGNRTIAEELDKAKKNRNYGVGLSFLASMASMAVVYFAVPAVVNVVAGMLGVPPPIAISFLDPATYSWAGAGLLAVSSVVGLATYNAVKIPLHWLGDKLFGLDKETTHERIESLGREREAGKVISREQVLAVFADAHPKLDGLIAARYGDSFDKLHLADKQRAAEEIGKMIPLEQFTSDINAGKVNVTELAFAVEGQISGVEREGPKPKKHGLMRKMVDKVMRPFKSQSKEEHAMTAPAAAHSYPEFDNPDARGGNVDRLGRPERDISKGFRHLVEHPAPNAPSSQTIQ